MDNSEQIQAMIGGLIADYKKDWYIRQMINNDLAALVLKDVMIDGASALQLDLIDIDQAETRRRDYLRVIEMPEDLPSDVEQAAQRLTIYLAIQLDKFLSHRLANRNRTQEARRAAAQKAVNARWSKAKKPLEA